MAFKLAPHPFYKMFTSNVKNSLIWRLWAQYDFGSLEAGLPCRRPTPTTPKLCEHPPAEMRFSCLAGISMAVPRLYFWKWAPQWEHQRQFLHGMDSAVHAAQELGCSHTGGYNMCPPCMHQYEWGKGDFVSWPPAASWSKNLHETAGGQETHNMHGCATAALPAYCEPLTAAPPPENVVPWQ